VSKELEGDWEGALSLPNGQSRPVIIHFKNQPDRTVEATIESPTQGVQGFPLKRSCRRRRGGVCGAGRGRSYKGTLNKEGTQIAGDGRRGKRGPAHAQPEKEIGAPRQPAAIM